MGFDPNSKKFQKRARQHAVEAAKVFKSHDPLCGKTWAVTEEQRQAAIDRGWAWGTENGAIRIVRATDNQANSAVLEGGWGVGGLVMPKTEPTSLPDGISTKYEEGKVPEWVDTTPPKTEAELLKERVDTALIGWPWKGTPSKLISTVRAHDLCFSTGRILIFFGTSHIQQKRPVHTARSISKLLVISDAL
jgi:hypothetical protein